VSRAAGHDAEKLLAVNEWAGDGRFTAVERAVLAYTDAMSATPAAVTGAVRADLAAHLTEHQVVELTHAIAWEHLRARFNRGLGITSDGYNEGHACVLPAHLQPPAADRP
jgi:alkylhydroperoxidase family enzyme